MVAEAKHRMKQYEVEKLQQQLPHPQQDRKTHARLSARMRVVARIHRHSLAFCVASLIATAAIGAQLAKKNAFAIPAEPAAPLPFSAFTAAPIASDAALSYSSPLPSLRLVRAEFGGFLHESLQQSHDLSCLLQMDLACRSDDVRAPFVHQSLTCV